VLFYQGTILSERIIAESLIETRLNVRSGLLATVDAHGKDKLVRANRPGFNLPTEVPFSCPCLFAPNPHKAGTPGRGRSGVIGA
jgi:hypothetical protein